MEINLSLLGSHQDGFRGEREGEDGVKEEDKRKELASRERERRRGSQQRKKRRKMTTAAVSDPDCTKDMKHCYQSEHIDVKKALGTLQEERCKTIYAFTIQHDGKLRYNWLCAWWKKGSGMVRRVKKKIYTRQGISNQFQLRLVRNHKVRRSIVTAPKI